MELSRRPARRPLRISLTFPVLMKEMRSRMRGLRAPVLLFITTALTVVVALIIIITQWGQMDWASHAPGHYPGYYAVQNMAQIGHSLFVGLIILLSIVGALIAPALTAGSISIEKEQQTLDLLLLTRLSCANIVLGKLFSSLGFLIVILLCALPVLAISFLLGGVDPARMFWSLVTLLSIVTLFGAIAIYCSARYPRTATSVALSYCFVLIWMAAIPLFIWLFMIIYDSVGTKHALDIPYLVFSTATGSLLALVPTVIFSLLVGTAARRPLPRLANIIVWLLCTGGAVLALLVFPDKIHDVIENQTVLCLVGNPAVAVTALVTDDLFMYSSYTGIAQFAEENFAPLTAAVCFLGAWIIVLAAVREVRKFRDNLEPLGTSRRRRPRKDVTARVEEAVG